MTFEYFYVAKGNGTLDLDDIGNCTIEAVNDLNKHFYLCIKTKLGSSRILEYGPYIPDAPVLYDTAYTFKKIEYDDRKLRKIIEGFLNNPYRNITQAFEIDAEQMYENCIDIVDNIKKEEY